MNSPGLKGMICVDEATPSNADGARVRDLMPFALTIQWSLWHWQFIKCTTLIRTGHLAAKICMHTNGW